MNINIICVGKLKERFWRDAIEEYSKRINGSANFKITELPEARLSDNPSDSEILLALSKEAKAMRAYLSEKSSFNVAMCVEGKLMSSEDLAREISRAGVDGMSTVNFFIGSSYGLSEEVKSACRLRLSMSKMTLPHQLARVVLTEQIYRALSINAGTKYHK